MFDLDDPDMKEIVDEFCDESDGLLEEIRDILFEFEDNPTNPSALEQFGQVIDRIMGASKTLGLSDIGHLCQMGKIIGYKGSQVGEQPLQEVTCGVLMDLCDFLEELLTNLRNSRKETDYDIDAFKGRLQWLAAKFRHIDRASCEIEGKKSSGKNVTTAELDRLINQFGQTG